MGDLCEDVDRYYEEKAPLEPGGEAVVTVAAVDRKGIVIRKLHEDQAETQVPPTNPDKPGKKKMATVISTYVSRRHVRTADDILREVSDEGKSDSKPKRQNKITWGSLTEASEKTVARLKAVDQRLPKGN